MYNELRMCISHIQVLSTLYVNTYQVHVLLIGANTFGMVNSCCGNGRFLNIACPECKILLRFSLFPFWHQVYYFYS